MEGRRKGARMMYCTMTAQAKKVLAACLLAATVLLLGLGTAPPAGASTTFLVNTIDDQPDANTGDWKCFALNASCTLRAAIEQANASPGADTINFSIAGGGVQTIKPASSLPAITEQVTIDGYTQTGASPNTLAVGDNAVLKIVLDGSEADALAGLTIANSSGSVIKGLVINNFGPLGTQIPPAGIFISGDSVGNRVQGNFVGTNAAGTLDQGNFQGVEFTEDFQTGALPSQNIIGGATPAARNVISGNEVANVFVTGVGNQIKGNYIGTDRSGTQDLGFDGDGIKIEGFGLDNTVGGTTSASRNVISGNDLNGVDINMSRNNVLGNRIGTTANGTGVLGNGGSGISTFGDDNLIGDGSAGGSNTIAFNLRDGVAVFGSSAGNKVLRNSIFSNDGLGIDLINATILGEGEDLATDIFNPNDTGDADFGPNNLQNRPRVSSARNASGKTTIKGTLSSTASKTYTVQFFSNPSGTNEGKVFIGQKSVSTDGTGEGSFTFVPSTKVSSGRSITATATRITTGDTSEFSTPRTVTSS
jgi:CSLREA domain-containing protein